MRKQAVDWSSLLGRSACLLPAVTEAVTDRRVLITGAGGSIGLALAEHLSRSSPASLVLVDAAEHALYTLGRTLTQPHQPVLGSVTDRSFLHALFHAYRPQIIFHAAAYKHVTIVEQNPFAGIANNALGTACLAEAAAKYCAEQLVLVSTDKAVDPVSLMGASKRIAELVLLAVPPSALTAKIVRLANVLGSRGSVVPVFLDQLAHGQALTISDPQARRYFITLDECVHALTEALTCDQTLLTAYAGESICVLELARFLSAQAGLPGHPIRFTGLSPADKRDEQLLGNSETWAWPEWSAAGLRAIRTPMPDPDKLASSLNKLREAVEDRNLALLLATVQSLVPGYEPSTVLTGPQVTGAA